MKGKDAVRPDNRMAWVLWYCACLTLSSCASVQSASFYRAVWKVPTNPKTMLLYKDTEEIPQERFAQVKHSFPYYLAENLVLSENLKKRLEYSAEKLSKWLLKTDQSKSILPPSSYYREFAIEKIVVRGKLCYFMSPLNSKSPSNSISPLNAQTKGKAILFLHGGGGIYEMHPVHWDFSAQIIRETGLPICLPMYPIYPAIDAEFSVNFIIECYQELLRRYPESETIIMGDSAGANLTLNFCHYLSQHRDEYADLPFPDKLILISPAMIAGNEDAIIAEMKKIEPRDVMLSMNMLKILPELFQFPPGELNWYTAPLYGDFSQFPPMYVFSGTFDIFYPQIKPFVERVRSQGKYIEFYTGWQMMHNWVILPAIPECVLGFKAVKEIIESPPPVCD